MCRHGIFVLLRHASGGGTHRHKRTPSPGGCTRWRRVRDLSTLPATVPSPSTFPRGSFRHPARRVMAVVVHSRRTGRAQYRMLDHPRGASVRWLGRLESHGERIPLVSFVSLRGSWARWRVRWERNSALADSFLGRPLWSLAALDLLVSSADVPSRLNGYRRP